jgi:hypothetical protein
MKVCTVRRPRAGQARPTTADMAVCDKHSASRASGPDEAALCTIVSVGGQDVLTIIFMNLLNQH